MQKLLPMALLICTCLVQAKDFSVSEAIEMSKNHSACATSDLGKVYKAEVISGVRAKKITGGQFDAQPNKKYLLIYKKLDDLDDHSIDGPIVDDAETKDFQVLLGTDSCVYYPD